MFWILVASGILGLGFACWAVIHSIFDSANRVLEMIDHSPPTVAAFPRKDNK